jgi:recombinational DNA repair protein RecT
MELIHRSGKISHIEAQVVYAKDKFKIKLGTNPTIEHDPSLAADRGDIIGAYAYATLPESPLPIIEWMPKNDLEKIRARSKAKESGPWVTDTVQMFRKCPIRRIQKFLPKTPEILTAMESDDEQFDFTNDYDIPTQADEHRNGVAGVKDKLKAQGRPAAKPVESKPVEENIEQDETDNTQQATNDSDFIYTCLKCDNSFDKPAPKGLCPKCLSDDIAKKAELPTK